MLEVFMTGLVAGGTLVLLIVIVADHLGEQR